ncbi:hypothetical protein ACH5A7_17080 [Streptomyces sp. NPDC018955]|uniref:hypothetical protein n=1 Tax=Streptomyces sp. NPDC018955 TaxID=3365055 RepID=UPI0037ABABD6
MFEEHLVIFLPPQSSKPRELVDFGLAPALRQRTEPLVRAGVGPALDQGAGTGPHPGVRHVDRSGPPGPWPR